MSSIGDMSKGLYIVRCAEARAWESRQSVKPELRWRLWEWKGGT